MSSTATPPTLSRITLPFFHYLTISRITSPFLVLPYPFFITLSPFLALPYQFLHYLTLSCIAIPFFHYPITLSCITLSILALPHPFLYYHTLFSLPSHPFSHYLTLSCITLPVFHYPITLSFITLPFNSLLIFSFISQNNLFFHLSSLLPSSAPSASSGACFYSTSLPVLVTKKRHSLLPPFSPWHARFLQSSAPEWLAHGQKRLPLPVALALAPAPRPLLRVSVPTSVSRMRPLTRSPGTPSSWWGGSFLVKFWPCCRGVCFRHDRAGNYRMCSGTPWRY